MSAGAFEDGKYSDDDGNVYFIRHQPETVGLTLNGAANALPAGAVDQPIAARATGGRRGYGVRARSVRIRFTDAVPEGYKPDSIIELPVYTLAAFNTMKAVRKPTGTYLGLPVTGVGFTPESVK